MIGRPKTLRLCGEPAGFGLCCRFLHMHVGPHEVRRPAHELGCWLLSASERPKFWADCLCAEIDESDRHCIVCASVTESARSCRGCAAVAEQRRTPAVEA